jgi:malate synthase
MKQRGTRVVGGVSLSGERVPDDERVLTPEALALVAHLTRRFGEERRRLLDRRHEAQRRFDSGALPAPPAGRWRPRRPTSTIAVSRSRVPPSPR